MFVLVIIFFTEAAALTGDNVVLQSMRIKPYDLSFHGFKKSSEKNVKRYILAEMKGTDPLKILKKEKPDLIYAIGADSLFLVRDLKIPVVYSTIFAPEKIVGKRNIKGVDMSLSPKRILTELKKRLPGENRLGFIKRGNEDLKELKAASKTLGFKLVITDAGSSGAYIQSLKRIREKIDILVLSPTKVLMGAEVIEFLFLTAMDNKIKVVAFSGKYAKMGALLSMEPDLENVGKKAYQLSKKILSGKKPKEEALHASKVRVIVNLNVARVLNIKPDAKLLKNAYIIK